MIQLPWYHVRMPRSDSGMQHDSTLLSVHLSTHSQRSTEILVSKCHDYIGVNVNQITHLSSKIDTCCDRFYLILPMSCLYIWSGYDCLLPVPCSFQVNWTLDASLQKNVSFYRVICNSSVASWQTELQPTNTSLILTDIGNITSWETFHKLYFEHRCLLFIIHVQYHMFYSMRHIKIIRWLIIFLRLSPQDPEKCYAVQVEAVLQGNQNVTDSFLKTLCTLPPSPFMVSQQSNTNKIRVKKLRVSIVLCLLCFDSFIKFNWLHFVNWNRNLLFS